MQNRDTTAAHVARLDRAGVQKRVEIARRMLREGAVTKGIMAVTKAETGMAIGAGTIGRIRREMAKEERRRERKAYMKAYRSRPAEKVEAEAPALNGNAGDVVAALLKAGVPFSFDGKRLVVSATELRVAHD